MFDLKQDRFRTEVMSVHKEDTSVGRLFSVNTMVLIVKLCDLSSGLSGNNFKVKWHLKSVAGSWVTASVV